MISRIAVDTDMRVHALVCTLNSSSRAHGLVTPGLAGMHLLITGGSSGIGLAAGAMIAANQGASLTLVARDQSKLDAAKKKVEAANPGCRVAVYSVDLSSPDESSMQAAFTKATQHHARPVDVLLLCTGFAKAAGLMDRPMSFFTNMMACNWGGSLVAARACLPDMLETARASKRGKHPGGRIVFVSSMYGLVRSHQFGLHSYAAYCSSKFAVRGLAHALQMEVAPAGIRVCVAYQADTDTPMYHIEHADLPAEPKALVGGAELFSAERVAADIIAGTKRGSVSITTGMDGFLLRHRCAGFGPQPHAMSALLEVLLAPFLRVVGLGYNTFFFAKLAAMHRTKAK
eukprot:jgi/Mesvir1/18636/Mv17143-RA.1